MRNILSAVLGLAFTVSAHAQPAFGDLSALGQKSKCDGHCAVPLPVPPVPAAVRPSRNYKVIDINNDGSVTLSGPRFSNPTGAGNIPISGQSNADGVCRLFGFSEAKAYGVGGTYVATAVIGADAKIKDVAKASYGYENWGMDTLICGQVPGAEIVSPKPTVQERVERIFINDDGSITLLHPFALKGGLKIPINGTEADLNAVCAYFGLGSGVTKEVGGNYLVTFGIARSGLAKVVSSRNVSYNIGIESVVCKPK